MEAEKLGKVPVEEYLVIEREAREKYEYHDGYIYAMAGGTLNHGLICGNIFGEIRAALKAKHSDCRAMSSEIKLHVASQNSFLYPDTMVICGAIEPSAIEPNAVTNPTVIVEVLSKTTATYDRGDKFYIYRQITSLREYVLIEQDKAQIEVYQRQADLWKITRVTGLDQQLQLSSLNVVVPLAAIYEDVAFTEN